MRLVLALVALSSGLATEAQANWSANVGYQNPAVSTYGLNFLYLGSQWAFETGIGWIDAEASADDDDDDAAGTATGEAKDKDDGASVHVAGDIDVKYLFSGGGLRPYIQAGVGVGIGAAAGDDSGAGAGTGGGFVGIGLFVGGTSAYGYASINAGGGDSTFVQAGIGLDI